MQIITTEKHPIYIWTDKLEAGAMEQARNLANLPFIIGHVAIMADGHFGYGMPIGGVIATKNVIIPNGVGVDIGCGVCAQKTNLPHISKNEIQNIFNDIRKAIPLGFKHHKKGQKSTLMPTTALELSPTNYPVISAEFNNATKQLGTLGGGNHFIEIQKDQKGNIWFMIHSGSRNLGYTVANYHNKIAVTENAKRNDSIPKTFQLAPLFMDTKQGQTYFREMEYCVEFALINREVMMQKTAEIFRHHFPCIEFSPMINIAHNYAAKEDFFNTDVIVHRKGATRANKGETGIIPGSQGSQTYIVRGKGNPQSFCSCSHGAGRKLGRKQAQKQLDLHKEIKKLDDNNIIHSIRSKKDLDEACGAYKNIEKVMQQQEDLVEVTAKLKPLGVIKG